MTTLLALDTSTPACSVALWHKGAVAGSSVSEPRAHTRLLKPMIRELMAQAGLRVSQLDAIAFGRGPGSFTGLRITAGLVQGLAWGLDRPVVPVSSLEAVAFQGARQFPGRPLAVAFDARMEEVYWGCFAVSEAQVSALGREQVCPPEQVALPAAGAEAGWAAVGSGWSYRHRMPAAVTNAMAVTDEALAPSAEDIARLAVPRFERDGGQSPIEAQPVYVRDEVSWQKLPGR